MFLKSTGQRVVLTGGVKATETATYLEVLLPTARRAGPQNHIQWVRRGNLTEKV